MNSVRDILDAIRALPRPDRLKLAEALTQEIEGEKAAHANFKPPPGSLLELRDGFYVYTGRLGSSAFDHRVDREERIDELISRIDAHRA
ncbi:MAG TPA: hypothetical protein VI197_31875 [Polyangiaceae bacterium]